MHLLAFVLGIIFTATALAFPSSRERFDARVARRAKGTSRLPATTSDASTARRSKHLSRPKITNATHDVYTANWAGAVLNADAGTWATVEGTFTVPIPGPAPGQTQGGASAWVGIDGDSCGTAILQTGVDFNYFDGEVSYDAWYEWYPEAAYDFDEMIINPGDSITAIVETVTSTLGYAWLINNNSGQEVGIELASGVPLCEQDAEWIVEDFEVAGGLVPFADFGTVTFTGAVAGTNFDTSAGPAGATIIDIEQGAVLTSASVTGSSITVTYN
ncbi:peptidase G1 domain-containing protein [Phanerochaete sordida]|uniref:Peptidase G1 domain-containing protein n=1 Tax=Phanerochaete sordida TaxID=48140 RepID=A0A9P3LIG0_9APHY|nr:peptidase G1 domain-containing protein [Phanerochaete sordida]